MGYNLYITRRSDWSDDGIQIPFEELTAFVESDPKLTFTTDDPETAVLTGSETDWLTWNRGNIYTKNPNEHLVDEMVRIAASLNARVQGDDGETYEGSQVVLPPTPPGLVERIRLWWNDRRQTTSADIDLVESPFQVGDRVKDIFGDQCVGTVRRVDVKANRGLGLIVVDYDDGRTGKWLCIGHGLVSLDESAHFDASDQSHHSNDS